MKNYYVTTNMDGAVYRLDAELPTNMLRPYGQLPPGNMEVVKMYEVGYLEDIKSVDLISPNDGLCTYSISDCLGVGVLQIPAGAIASAAAMVHFKCDITIEKNAENLNDAIDDLLDYIGGRGTAYAVIATSKMNATNSGQSAINTIRQALINNGIADTNITCYINSTTTNINFAITGAGTFFEIPSIK